MIDRIGETAGEIWKYLEKHEGATDFNSLRRGLGRIEENTLHLGLGWLAREGKVIFEGAERSSMIRLQR